MSRRPERQGLARQVTLVTCGVAAVAVLLSGLVAVGAVRGSYDGRAREVLQQQAALLASLSDRPAQARGLVERRGVRRVLARTGVLVVRVGPGGRQDAEPVLPADLVDAALSGAPASQVRDVAGTRYLVAVEPVAGGGAVVLLQPGSDARAAEVEVLRRVLLALLVGLLAAALLAAVLSRRLARPLVAAAGAARRLAGGERGLRLQPDGPAEVAGLADDLNALATALERSEARQRAFLLSVSHELRTPLTAVRGFAEALADGVVTGEQAREAGALVGREAARLQHLVDDLLDLARLGADAFRLELADTDLDALLAEAAGVWASRCAAEGVGLEVDRPGRPLLARTDAARVRQVLDGLAENALRLAPAGTPLVLALVADGAHAVLSVSDRGPGLTDDDLAVAFEQGVLHERYRGERPVGTGLGLALVRGLVERLGGEVTAGHRPGGGAVFTVRLPLTT